MATNIFVGGVFNVDTIPLLQEIFPEYIFHTAKSIKKGQTIDIFIFSAQEMLKSIPSKYVTVHKELYPGTNSKVLITSVDRNLLNKVSMFGDKTIINPRIGPNSSETIHTKTARQKKVYKEAIESLLV